MYVKPKKHLGQHFLTDLSVAKRIADSLRADRCSTVLEVGCGTGVLTKFLLERTDITLYGAEVDPESVAYLHEHYPQFAPRLIEGDFLRMDLAQRFPDGVNVIGNFPYNISSQIFFKILEYRDRVPEAVGMVQREVAVRIAEKPGTKDYGILSVFFAGFLRYRVPVYGRRGGVQPASESQERRDPADAQRGRETRLRRGAVRPGGQGRFQPAPQDDPQFAARRVRRPGRRRTCVFPAASRGVECRSIRRTNRLGSRTAAPK